MALSVFGLRPSAFLGARRDGVKQKVFQLHRAPEKTGLIVVVRPDPYEVGMLFLQLSDGGVEILIPAADLDLVLSLFKEQVRFLFSVSALIFISFLFRFFKPPVFRRFSSDRDPCFCTEIVSDFSFRAVLHPKVFY